MRISATSDLHGRLPEIPECDLLLIAGDVCPFENHSITAQRRWLNTRFAAWLAGPASAARTRIWIAGNHDLALELGGPGRRLRSRATYLQDSEISFEGLRIWGTPWSRTLGQWAFSLPERSDGVDLAAAFARVPEGIDILLAHSPPLSIADATPEIGSDGREFTDHIGSKALLELLDGPRAPKALVCGHCHEGYGIHEHRQTTIYNASHCDEQYRAVNPPLLFDL